jgi:hypothetical protein
MSLLLAAIMMYVQNQLHVLIVEVYLSQTLEFLDGQSQGLDLGLDTAQLSSSENRDASS